MRTLIALLLAMIAFAGCLDNDEAPETPDDSMDDSMEDAAMEPTYTAEYSWDSGLGCAGEGMPTPCVAYQNGPGSDGPDGYWIELEEGHAGLTLGSTVANQRGDSDCWFTDAEGAVVGDATNGAGPCSGTVPTNAVWVFVYSYAEPHQGLTITFS